MKKRHEHAIAQHNEAIARHKRLKSACRADAFAHFDKEETESDGTSASGTEWKCLQIFVRFKTNDFRHYSIHFFFIEEESSIFKTIFLLLSVQYIKEGKNRTEKSTI